jgi:hypothetical protein
MLVFVLADDYDYRCGLTTLTKKKHARQQPCLFVSAAWTTKTVTTTTSRSRSRSSSSRSSHVGRVIKLSSLSERRTVSSGTLFLNPMIPPVKEEQHLCTTINSNEEYDYSFDNNNNYDDDDDDDDDSSENDAKEGKTDDSSPPDIVAFAFDSTDFDGYVLDPDLYTQSRKLLNADGSLSLRLESLSMSSGDNDSNVNDSPSDSYDGDLDKISNDCDEPSFDSVLDDKNVRWSNPEDAFLQSTLLGTIPINDLVKNLVQQSGQSLDDDGDETKNSIDDATMDDLWEAIRKQRQAMETAEASASTSLLASRIGTKEVTTTSSNDSNAKASNDDGDVNDAVGDSDNGPTTTRGNDVLHDEIFAKEEAYLLQSQTFREALIGNDQEKAAKARSLRTGKAFRQRQEAAIQSLQEQMDDFEQNILPQLSSSSSSFFSRKQVASSACNKTASTRTNAAVSNIPMVRCSQCDCLLAKDEIDHWIRQRRRFQQQQLQQQQQQGQGQKSTNGDSGIDEIKRICRACHCDALVSQSNKRFAGTGGAYSSRSTKYDGRRSNNGYPASKMAAPPSSSMLQNALWRRQAQQQQQKSPPSVRPSVSDHWLQRESKTKVQHQQKPAESQSPKRAMPMKDEGKEV